MHVLLPVCQSDHTQALVFNTGCQGAETLAVQAAHGSAGGCWPGIASGCLPALPLGCQPSAHALTVHAWSCAILLILSLPFAHLNSLAARFIPNAHTALPQGSRKHYCINMHATRQTSIDEACEELLKESQVGAVLTGVVHSFGGQGPQRCCALWRFGDLNLRWADFDPGHVAAGLGEAGRCRHCSSDACGQQQGPCNLRLHFAPSLSRPHLPFPCSASTLRTCTPLSTRDTSTACTTSRTSRVLASPKRPAPTSPRASGPM